LGLVDAVLAETSRGFAQEAQQRAQALAADPALPERLQAKQARRQADEAQRPLADYRTDELARMHRNFYGFDPSYHIARSNFVRRVPPSWTPRHWRYIATAKALATRGAEIDSHQGS
jgi:putative two-component system hydrogenase maturation factor HypX/HoxX